MREGSHFEDFGLQQADSIALHVVVEGSDATGFPLLLCIDDRVNLLAERPAQFHKGIAHLIVIGLPQLGFGQYDKDVPVGTFTGLPSGTGAKQEYHTSFRRGVLGHLPDLAEYVSVLIRHNITSFLYPSAKLQKNPDTPKNTGNISLQRPCLFLFTEST